MSETVKRIIASKGRKPTITDILADAGIMNASGYGLSEAFKGRLGKVDDKREDDIVQQLYRAADDIGLRRGGEIDVSFELGIVERNLDRLLPNTMTGKQVITDIAASFDRNLGQERVNS